MSQTASGLPLHEAVRLHREGRLDEAERAYRAILAADPDAAETLRLLGTLLGQAGRLEECREMLLRAAALRPDDPDAHYNLGECLRRLGEEQAAADSYRAALAARPSHLNAALGLSGLLHGAGRAGEACEVCRAALVHAPEDPRLLSQLGGALIDAGDPAAARDPLEQAVARAPGLPMARRNLALALIMLGDHEPALDLLRPLVRAEPRSVDYLRLAAMGLGRSGQHKRAKPALERILDIDPSNIEAIGLLGDLHRDLMDIEQALECRRRAASLAPDDSWHAARVAELLERVSRLDEAHTWVDRALDLDPECALALLTGARLARRAGTVEDALAWLDRIAPAAGDDWFRAGVLFERGQAYEALGRHGQAFETFRRAHAARAATWQARSCDPSWHPAMQQALLTLFGAGDIAGRIASWPDEAPEDGLPAPCFLVGYPRSGTTLVERLLDAHPGVTATPELAMVSAMRKALDRLAPGGLGYPESLERIGPKEVGQLRAVYWEFLHARHAEPVGDRLVVDKHPLNLDHLGLVARAFPGAKVIVALRDPRDVCVSCFTTNFHPNRVTVRFSDLAETARAYGATMSLWRRYREVLPLDLFVYRYEDLVCAPRDVLGRIVAFLGLEWDDGLLDSAQANVGRYVATPSYTGVTEPVNARAVARWEGYAEQLALAMPLLRPFVEEFGYA